MTSECGMRSRSRVDLHYYASGSPSAAFSWRGDSGWQQSQYSGAVPYYPPGSGSVGHVSTTQTPVAWGDAFGYSVASMNRAPRQDLSHARGPLDGAGGCRGGPVAHGWGGLDAADDRRCAFARPRGCSPPPPMLLPAPPFKWLAEAPLIPAVGDARDPYRSSSSGIPPQAFDRRAAHAAAQDWNCLYTPPWEFRHAAAAAGVEAAWEDGGGAGAEGGGRRPRAGRRRNLLQVATQLKKLDHLDPLWVVRVRKISRLGFGSAEILRAHFERWGPVEEVLLSGAEQCLGGPQQRLRPSGFGFVVMASADAARCALAEPAQQVAGVWIEVHCFERLRPEAGLEESCTEHEREYWFAV